MKNAVWLAFAIYITRFEVGVGHDRSCGVGSRRHAVPALTVQYQPALAEWLSRLPHLYYRTPARYTVRNLARPQDAQRCVLYLDFCFCADSVPAVYKPGKVGLITIFIEIHAIEPGY